jgi:MFS family permease
MLLWSGQTVSEMGSAVTQLALPLTAVVVLRASTFQVGLLTSAATAAFALIALPAGALVDRRAKRQLMIWCDAARMLIVGSVPLAAAFGLLTLGQLYAVALTAGVCTVFFDVAYQSYLFGSMAVALEIVFLVRVLRVRPADTGLLVAVASLGGVAGGVLAGRLSRRIGSARIIWYSMLVLSLPELLVPLAAPGWRVAAFGAGMASFSFGAVVYNVAQVSYRQAICPPRLLGRMNAAMRWVV